MALNPKGLFVTLILTSWSFETVNTEKCLKEESIPEQKFFYHNNEQQKVTVLVNHRVSTRLVGSIFTIFAREMLGYDVDTVLSDEIETDFDTETTFSKLSSCKNEFCKDLDERPFNSRISSSQLKIPTAMVSLDTWLPPSSFVDKWGLIDVGQLGPAGRFGWFIPSRTEEQYPPLRDHWKVFRSNDSLDPFLLTDGQIEFIQMRMSRPSRPEDSGIQKSYFCHEKFCRDGFFTPPQCLNNKCAVLVTDYPALSSTFNTSLVTELINSNNLYVKIAFVGSNLEKVVSFLDENTKMQGNSFVVLHYEPSILTHKHDLTALLFPDCQDPLIFRPDMKPECLFRANRLAKVAWKPVQNRAPELFNFIENFSFEYEEYIELLDLYNNMSKTNNFTTMDQIACRWLRHNHTSHLYDPLTNQKKARTQAWYKNFPVKIRNQLYIGGIFPISGSKFTAPELGPVAIMAVNDINNNPDILQKHRLVLDIQDGQCEADVVMKKFIDFIKNKDPTRFRSTIGILGPACSNTVEPIAGVSKHYRTVVISYSAEGSISNSNSEDFPYFFRTIAENKQYKHAYLAALKKFGWKKVAALTQDGSKYSHYMSSLQDVFQENGIDFVLNRKFPRDTMDMSLYLEDLKERGAKVIIADFYEPAARHIMCQAYKLSMTQAQGYVWFLPGWYKEGWYDLDNLKGKPNYNEDNTSDEEVGLTALKYPPDCTTSQMLQALDGALSLVHTNYAPDDSYTVGNITVAEWKGKLKKELDLRMQSWLQKERSKSFDFGDGNKPSKYSGYVYDAVWLYALALDKLMKVDKALVQDLHSEKTMAEFVKIIKEQDFDGVSGRINFQEGHSRLSEINILQLEVFDLININSTDRSSKRLETKEIGLYKPNYKNRSSLSWHNNRIRWKTKNGEKPIDEDRNCGILTPFAIILNLECQLTITVAFLIGFGLVLGALLGLFAGLKMRYESKMRDTEERMRALGLLTPMSVLALDDWEMPRDRVVINRKLGEGAFGMVYGGEAFFDDRGWVAVAVKTLKAGSSPEEKIDFLSEADMMKRFEHKNIVKLLGVCTRNEPVYTVMEYMLYGDLKTYLLARRHLVNERNREELDEVSNKRLTNMAYDIAAGLAFLADQKYVHRDVACRNCLVNAGRSVKLADFGMTRPMFESDYYRFSRKGMLPVRWMSPESLADGIFTPLSDIWSYGVLLYEIITFGSFPFQGLSNNQVLENVKSGATLTIPMGIKMQLGSLLKSCWSRTPTKRPAAGEIVELLYNNPRLVSPCIDVPLASVQIERTDSLELIPSAKKSPVHTTVIGSGQKHHCAEENEKCSSEVSDSGQSTKLRKESQTNGSIYSPMHGSNKRHQLSDFSITEPLFHPDSDLADSGYYKPDFSVTEPLVIQETDFTDSNGYYKSDFGDKNHNVAVGSYVQPGYIFLGEGD